MMQNMFEKLQLTEEKNILIQGLPSTIEKQFAKVTFSKNVTPLLKSRKIDFALIFAVNQCQLNSILKDVLGALHENGKLWIAYPKPTSKIVSDLNRDCSWDMLLQNGYEVKDCVILDHVWTAQRFIVTPVKGSKKAAKVVKVIQGIPVDNAMNIRYPAQV